MIVDSPERLCNDSRPVVCHTTFSSLFFGKKKYMLNFNPTSVGKNINFNQVCGRVVLLPSYLFSHYVLLLCTCTYCLHISSTCSCCTVLFIIILCSTRALYLHVSLGSALPVCPGPHSPEEEHVDECRHQSCFADHLQAWRRTLGTGNTSKSTSCLLSYNSAFSLFSLYLYTDEGYVSR